MLRLSLIVELSPFATVFVSDVPTSRYLLMLVATFATPFIAELDSEWESYKMTHNKQYETDIEPLRLIYVTRHDILCPNAVKRDVGKTRCKSDVIYATALCSAICTSLSVICLHRLKSKRRISS